MTNKLDIEKNKLPFLGDTSVQNTSVLLWGDSHARALISVIDILLKEKGIKGCAATHHATPPILNWYYPVTYGLGDRSIAYNQAVFEYIKRKKIKHVILVANWKRYAPYSSGGDNKHKFADSFYPSLSSTIKKLVGAGVKPWVVLDVPNHNFPVLKELRRSSITGENIIPFCSTPKNWKGLDDMNPQLILDIKNIGGCIIDPKPKFIDPEIGCYSIEKEGFSLYRDGDHLSEKGAEIVMLPFLRESLLLKSASSSLSTSRNAKFQSYSEEEKK